jgi:outer membrane protein assembly factor BamB
MITTKLHHAKPVLCASLLAGALSLAGSAHAENWPCWRGPRGDGTVLETNVPTQWDVATQALWKTAVPGTGHASAIVWGNRVFTVTAQPEKLDRILLCFDRATGNILWQQTVVHGPLEKIHKENSYASGTPATDGKRVYVTFRVGDEIVVGAHDLDGKQLWLVRPGTHVGEWGFSNEPVLYGDKVILDGDSKGKSFLIALSREDGRTLWRVNRSHQGISYSAPLIREMAGRLQLVQCGDRCVASFDPDSGRLLWTVDGPSQEFAATPFYSQKAGLVFVSSSWPETHLLAIKPDGDGNVTGSHIAWRDNRGAPYIPSLIVAGDFLFSVNASGTAFCYEAATGKVFWQERLGRHHASPVLVGGLLYFINDNGEVNVIRPGQTFDRVAAYKLGESCYASPAISDGQVFLRGFKHLFCIGQPRH